MVQKKNEKPKTTKDQKKEIEDKTFGMKNRKKCRDVKKQLDKITINEKKQKPVETKIVLNQPKAPVGTDPKDIMCVYYLNKMCDKGDKCKYGHEKKKIFINESKIEDDDKHNKLVCRFLIDAINDGQLTANWECPNKGCKDIHKLVEVGDIEISLEEFIELKRQNVQEEDFITEETFLAWKNQKKKEDEEHKRRVKAMKEGISGSELFREKPEMFIDDDEALECDYNERNYSEEEAETGDNNLNVQ
ncbi:Translation machinery-associated protein 46 [Conglomerata obtusa]